MGHVAIEHGDCLAAGIRHKRDGTPYEADMLRWWLLADFMELYALEAWECSEPLDLRSVQYAYQQRLLDELHAERTSF